jgi:hypothetical protein
MPGVPQWRGMGRGIAALLLLAPLVAHAADDKQRLLSEACQIMAQQRNSLADALAVAEAGRQIEAEDSAKMKQRLADWDAYFKAYVGTQ